MILAKVLAPLAPFLGEELHEMLGGKGSVFKSAWPVFDAERGEVGHGGNPGAGERQAQGRSFTAPAGSSAGSAEGRWRSRWPELAGITPKKVDRRAGQARQRGGVAPRAVLLPSE